MLPAVRILLAFLIALSVATAPVGPAMAAAKSSAMTTAMAGMEHCDKSQQNSNKTAGKCCCDTKSCASGTCALKCFKISGTAPEPNYILQFRVTHPEIASPTSPPDWLSQPQPPPPRA